MKLILSENYQIEFYKYLETFACGEDEKQRRLFFYLNILENDIETFSNTIIDNFIGSITIDDNNQETTYENFEFDCVQKDYANGIYMVVFVKHIEY